MKENMHELGVVGDHMLPRGVVEKGRCYCRLILWLQEKRMLINHKPNNYD
jgi:hypothetical protein